MKAIKLFNSFIEANISTENAKIIEQLDGESIDGFLKRQFPGGRSRDHWDMRTAKGYKAKKYLCIFEYNLFRTVLRNEEGKAIQPQFSVGELGLFKDKIVRLYRID